MAATSVGPDSQEVTGGASRRHFVHVYAVIRAKVAVNAHDHRAAMEAADEVLFSNGFAVRFTPKKLAVLDVDYAEEVTAYLVDEADDEEYARSRNYGPDHEPEEPPLTAFSVGERVLVVPSPGRGLQYVATIERLGNSRATVRPVDRALSKPGWCDSRRARSVKLTSLMKVVPAATS